MNYGVMRQIRLFVIRWKGWNIRFGFPGVSQKSGSFHRSSVKRPEKDLWKDTDGTYDQRTKADQIFYRAG